MMTQREHRRHLASGQTISEYGIVIGTVIFALIVMQTYIRRYVQAEVKLSTDQLLSITGADAAAGGVETQRLSRDPLAPDAGFNRTSLIGEYNTSSTRAMVESPSGGAGSPLAASTDTSVVERTGKQQTVQVRRMLPNQALPPGRLFSRDDKPRKDVQRPGN